jgi:hypothetical protein
MLSMENRRSPSTNARSRKESATTPRSYSFTCPEHAHVPTESREGLSVQTSWLRKLRTTRHLGHDDKALWAWMQLDQLVGVAQGRRAPQCHAYQTKILGTRCLMRIFRLNKANIGRFEQRCYPDRIMPGFNILSGTHPNRSEFMPPSCEQLSKDIVY